MDHADAQVRETTVHPVALPQSNRAPLAVASFVAQVVFLVLLAIAGVAFSQRLDTHQTALERQREGQAVMQERVDALATETKHTNAELLNLRQTVASSASEEVLFLKCLVLKRDIDLALARNVASLVHKNAQLYGRDPNLVLAIMAVESDFNPNALSNVGAVGLMQVMPHWKRVLGITGELTDPEINIRAGLQILGFYLEMYQDLDMALTAYNRGPGPVEVALRNGHSANNGYAPRVRATYERLKTLSFTEGSGSK